LSISVLIEAVELEGFGGGGAVPSAFGDVLVTGVFDGHRQARAWPEQGPGQGSRVETIQERSQSFGDLRTTIS